MRLLRLWLDDAQVGCGHRIFLEVSQGREYAHLLHIPTLSHVKLPLRTIEEQLRRGRGSCELPLRRGLIGAIEQRRREFNGYNFRYAGNLVDEALAGLRAHKEP